MALAKKIKEITLYVGEILDNAWTGFFFFPNVYSCELYGLDTRTPDQGDVSHHLARFNMLNWPKKPPTSPNCAEHSTTARSQPPTALTFADSPNTY